MLTSRGRLVLALGAVLYLAAWAFGSAPLYPVAVGLVVAVAVARTWIQLAGKPMQLRRGTWGADRFEGDDVPVDIELSYEGRLLPTAVMLTDDLGSLGRFEVELRRRPGRTLTERYVVARVPRGRYSFGDAELALEDPFGLARAELRLESPGALVVYPRLVELDELFTEAGAHRLEGRRLLLRRPTGFDVHSVREHQEGESLRSVHWPTTARRGQLMVKELEDAPRDEIAVLLDAAAGVNAGDPPDSSFDAQVRAAGSILWAHARRGRRAVLVVNNEERAAQGVGAEDADFRLALDLLAAAQPTGRIPAAALLAEDASRAARALELVVVTASLRTDLVERLVQRANGSRRVSIVYVDAPTWGDGDPAPQGALLRLHAAGVPVAVVRRGDDLAAALAGGARAEAAVG